MYNSSMTTITWPQTETTFLLPGPVGDLEVAVNPVGDSEEVAIICHPHPLHGGTMNNKVVTTVAKAFAQKGISTVRFNYRGVGASEGSFGDFVGETADLLAVIDWVLQQKPHAKLWLAGFSFGAYIAAQGALQRANVVQQLFSIAPAVRLNNFDQFITIQCPWVVIQGEQDEIIAPTDVYAWVERMMPHAPIKLFRLPETSHFFHGKLLALRDILVSEINTP